MPDYKHEIEPSLQDFNLTFFDANLVKPQKDFPVLVEGYLEDSDKLEWFIGSYQGEEFGYSNRPTRLPRSRRQG